MPPWCPNHGLYRNKKKKTSKRLCGGIRALLLLQESSVPTACRWWSFLCSRKHSSSNIFMMNQCAIGWYVHDRRKFRSQTSDNMDRWKSRGGKSQREDQRRERVRGKKMQVRKKVAKSRNIVFFQWFVAPEGRKVGLLKRQVRSHVVRWEMKSCTLLWREAHFEVKAYKAHHSRTTFASWDVKKVRAVVARSRYIEVKMYKAHHVRTTRCRKSARRCGLKHILKSKVPKTVEYGALLDVQMSFCVAGTRDCAPCQKWAKRNGFVPVSTTTTTTLHSTPLHYTTTTTTTTTITRTTTTLHYITLHYITQHFLYYTTLHYATLHYNTLQHTNYNYSYSCNYNYNYTTLHYANYTTIHYTPLCYNTLHSTTLNYTTLHFTTLHCTALHYTNNSYNYNYTTLHYTTVHELHYTTLHFASLHSITLH